MILSMLIFPGYRYNYSNSDNIKNKYKDKILEIYKDQAQEDAQDEQAKD